MLTASPSAAEFYLKNRLEFIHHRAEERRMNQEDLRVKMLRHNRQKTCRR